MIQVKNLFCGYGSSDVLRGLNFQVNQGEIVCIIGANGCGKSTLLKAIDGLMPYRGSILINQMEARQIPRKVLARQIGLVSQISTVGFPYSVYDTVALGRYPHHSGVFVSLSQEEHHQIQECLQSLGLWELRDRTIDQLSGGQLQRVFLARVFVQDPQVILLDEPTNHLDFQHQIGLLDQLKDWSVKRGRTVIGVLHDLNLVQYFAQRVLLVQDGIDYAFGSCDQVFTSENLKACYGIDIRNWMMDALKRWEG